jgi:HSP20 family protein
MAQNAMVQKEENRTRLATPERTRGGTVTWTPRCDIFETADELLVYADLPGVEPGNLDIRFEKGELVIHGKVKPRQQSGEFVACEYGIGDFYRAFSVGEALDTDKITAELKQGVLTLHLPRSESVKPKKIPVKA